ncbi:sugar transporter [bacterium]|nr:MAG: sugar transporter [bacterium]
MKMLFVVMVVALAAFAANAQPPVRWKASAKLLKKNVFEIRLTAVINEGWYIYSQFMENNGPQPTSITFERSSVDTIGKAIEFGKLQQKFDAQFGMEIAFFYNKVEFVQQVRVKGKLPITMNGEVMYMGCNEQMCLPPQVEQFSVLLK